MDCINLIAINTLTLTALINMHAQSFTVFNARHMKLMPSEIKQGNKTTRFYFLL